MAKNTLQQESEKWFRDLIKSTTNKKAGETYSKGERRSIKPGNMVFFHYTNPKTFGEGKPLKSFDKYPLPIILDIRGNYMLAINTHWVPKPLKETLIKMVVKLNKQQIKKDKRLQLTYQEIKEFLHRTGLIHIALKKYLINRITGLKYIPYSDWKYQLHLPTYKFVRKDGVTAQDVENMIRSAISKNKKSKNKRYGR